jgi:hypothetical protein
LHACVSIIAIAPLLPRKWATIDTDWAIGYDPDKMVIGI